MLILESRRSEGVHFLVKLQAVGLQLITTNKPLERGFSRNLLKFETPTFDLSSIKRAPYLAEHLSMAAHAIL